ncbi:MAG TPA: hypothetical protein VLI04_13855, partial [Nocardioidaceae bacterium]|nr:hypothetical protein [Nocardioidaceae bacterium]
KTGFSRRQVTTMNTNTEIRKTAHNDLYVSCRCGQDLDVVAGHHCPRCGTTLRQAYVLVLAA